jgi:hypothetical protein
VPITSDIPSPSLLLTFERSPIHCHLLRVSMVKTRANTSTVDHVALPPQTRRSRPRARSKAKEKHDTNNDDETLDEGDDTATPTAARAPDDSLSGKVHTNEPRQESNIGNPVKTTGLAATSSPFSTVTKRGPPRGLPKDRVANSILPGQGKPTSALSTNNVSPLMRSVSGHLM